MLTRVRSLFSRVFSFDTPSSQIRHDETFDHSSNDDESSQSSSIKSKFHYTRSHEQSQQNCLINTMQIAISRCNIESMKRLLNNFDININHCDQYGISYLEHAILIGHFNMVDLLIRNGCDLYQGNSNGHSYLYVAIEITTNKSFEIIRLLLESNCSCLSSIDIISLTSLKQIIYINSQNFLLLNTYILFILKYHIHRIVLKDVLSLINYFIITNLLLCKNDKHYELNSHMKITFSQFNTDYISLFIKIFRIRYAFKLEHKLNIPSSLLVPLTDDDIQPYRNRIIELTKHVPDLKHLCRLLIREKFKKLKISTITSIVPTIKLQDYVLYTPI